MFKRLRLRIRDMRTISALFQAADKHAHQNGEDMSGAEHFLLAAIDLPDGTARQTFRHLGVEQDALRAAIAHQYNAALQGVGLDTSHIGDFEPVTSNRIFNKSKPSVQNLMKTLADQRSHDKDTPLLSAHVLLAVASMKQGVAARALRIMGIDQDVLHAAAENEIRSFRG